MAKKKLDTSASIAVVIDRSGSMSSCRQQTIDGFNEFLGEQQKLPGAALGLVQFDSDKIDTLKVAPAAAVKPLDHSTYQPRGWTPLYDAVGQTILELEKAEPKGKVIFAVITDGYENASTKFNQQQIFDMVTRKRADGWEFVFMGAAMDAYGVGAQLGVAPTNTYAYAATGGSTSGAWSNLSSSSTSYRSGVTRSVSMPDVDTVDPTYQPAGGTAPVVAKSTTKLPVHHLGSTR